MPHIKKGEVICTEKGTPVYEVLQDFEYEDLVCSSGFKSLCDLPDPTPCDVILSHYNGERFVDIENGYFKFHFKDGYR